MSDGGEEEDNLFMQIFNFIDDLVVGETREVDINDNSIPTTLMSKSTLEALQMKISEILEKHTQMVDQNITITKNIYIDCGSNPITDQLLEKGRKKYDFLGNPIPGTGCINYGCCYDVSQTSQISLSTVNQSIFESIQEVNNTMIAELESKLGITIDPNEPAFLSFQEALGSSTDVTLENIRREFETLVNNDVEASQNIYLKVDGPLLCLNECDEPPTAGLIRQSINVDIAVKNIISNFVSSVTENYIKITSTSSGEGSNLDIGKLYAFCIIAVIFWVCIYTIGALLCKYWKALQECGGFIHIGGIVLVLVVWFFWKIVSCLVRGNNLFGCVIR